jgi:hypothetical protein
MKNRFLLIAIFAFLAIFLAVGGQSYFTAVSAQNNDAGKNPAAAPTGDDAALASLIKRLTDRSTDSLTQRRGADNSVSLDLGEGFQNVMLAKTGPDGEPAVACVTSLGEANEFFGRDLETGAPVASPVRDEVAETAARHGMSKEEFQFYSKMIADAAAQRAASPESATLNIVNGDGAGEGFNDPTAATPEGGNNGTTRGQQRLNLFQFAAGIWGAFLDSSVPIDINSQFNSLAPCTTSGGVLGSAGSTSLIRDFTGAEFTGTWYHGALANKQAGFDTVISGTGAEINARFNSDVDNGCLGAGSRFYYGLNNSTPANRVNLLVVLLHEMGHGLGFSAISVNGSTGALVNGFPDVFLLKMYDRTTGKYWKDMTNAERQASAINNGNVVWDGANVKIASSFVTNGGDSAGRVQLYTPGTLAPGSSISHFDTVDFPNLLMEPNINIGLPLDLDLTRQVMRDIGWYRDTTADLVPDTITAVNLSGNAVIGSPVAVRWTNTGGFNKNVTIELSTDGGTTFPTALVTDTANSGTFTFTVPNTPTSQARIRVREAGFIAPMGTTANFTIGTVFTTSPALFDYDGDGKSDVSIFRPSNGVWYVQNSSNGSLSINQFGANGDLSVPADYDGDDKTDIAIYRPANGLWYWLNSSNGTVGGNQFGTTGDIAAPGDYDGDGKADIAIYRPSTGNWWIYRSSDNGVSATQFGIAEDKPTLGDFDGDGKNDFAVFRPSNATWYRLNSSNGAFVVNAFGLSEDKTVAADYDNDGKTDIAIFRPSNGAWYWVNSSNGAVGGVFFGISEDKPAPGDYDGDGKSDPAVFRPSQGTWYLLRSTQGFTAQQFGGAGDIPTPNSFVQ